MFVKDDFETGMIYLEKAAKGGHKKAQEDLEKLKQFQNIQGEANNSNNKKNETPIQPIKTEEKKVQVKSNISVDDQLKDLRKTEVTLKNRAEKIIAAKYDPKHSFGEHTQAMRKALNTISSLFQQSLSATDDKTKERIIAQIQQQSVIAEQNAKWIEDNASLRQAVLDFENDFIKGPLSIFINADYSLRREKAWQEKGAALLNDIKNTGIQIDNLLDATDFKEAKATCQKSISNICKSYAAIGEIAADYSDSFVLKICLTVLSKLDPKQCEALEKKSSNRTDSLKKEIEKQIEEKDWSNAEKTMAELKKQKEEIGSYQQRIFYGALLNSISFNEKNLLTISVKDEKIIVASVQPGSFTMIDSFDTAYDIKLRSHNVNINQKYYIGITEVTQGLRDAVMGTNSSKKNTPVSGISWNDAQEFCKTLNTLTKGTRPEGYVFSLPTDAQWEYAARGGALSKGYKYSGSDKLEEIAWFSANSNLITHQVGTKAPNELGLFDMLGNVGEWCMDDYIESFRNHTEGDKPATGGSKKVIRGGSYRTANGSCNLSNRSNAFSYSGEPDVGFRLALVRAQE
ncbi:MAG: SUMF1/EgtB/PvdO family nonheme iron enzyme [Lentisphaeria bacterium]|nr:SUMF1/EgtB/PvdO family nonheme iron enzyme [Lentisphaeria bacterium]